MEIPVIKIGNSKGIRLKKAILERYNIKDRVEMVFEQSSIIIRAVNNPRLGWEKAFTEIPESVDDYLLMPDVFDDETGEEWN